MPPHTGVPVAVSLGNEHLIEVSSSVIIAETWLTNHVLAHYPATNITTIVVGHTLLCNKDQHHNMGLVLPSIKNIYYSLTRWGLEREIMVSASFSSNCLQNPLLFESYTKPLLNFLQATNLPYLVNPPPYLSSLSDETLSLVNSHLDSIKQLGVLISKINVIINGPKEEKPTSRKLSFLDSKFIDPIPARPMPLTPTHAPIGYSVPDYTANSPLPPLIGTPELPPMISPANPPFGYDLPPCNPSGGGEVVAAAPVSRTQHGLWCVAKPSVPADTLQEAMDYACGEGGADCEAIRPHGNCYFPDSLVAHASYAFNSYWQKTKKNGGTCGFGGTAMLINTDPSRIFPAKFDFFFALLVSLLDMFGYWESLVKHFFFLIATK